MPQQIFHSICISEDEHSWSINHLSIAHLKPGNQSQSIKITTRRNSSTLITITYSLHGHIAQWVACASCCMYILDRSRFFAEVGHQTTNASISLNNNLVRLTKIMNNLVKDLKISSSKVIFQCPKLVESFPPTKKNFCEEYFIRRPMYINEIFEIFDF